MKMVFYTASLGKGGAERVLVSLANYFSKNNDVTLIIERPIIDYEINSNIKLVSLDKTMKKSYNFISKKTRFLRYLFKLKKHFKSINPDVIVSFLAVPAFLSLIAKNKKSRIIISVRNDPKTEYTTFLKKKLMKILYPKADGFVFQTKEAQEYFKNIISCKQAIIFNPISNEFINTEPPIKREKTIVSVGRLHWQKNYPLLIEAFSEISNEYKDYRLCIYGEGNEREKLQNIINEKNMGERIKLMGNVDDVKNRIIDASLFIMTSNFEGMPNSLIEAMVLGLTVISTDCPCGGPRELIKNNENGILVQINNKEELVEAIKKILNDEELAKKLGREAKKIINKVEPSYINKQWKNFIDEVYEN